MKKKLTREQYKEKFDKQMERFNYIPQEGEKIVQCNLPYPEYWFLSNKGYLFSVYRDEITILNDNPTEQGRKNKSGERAGKKWRYASNSLPGRDVSAWKIMADHFCECEFSGHKYKDEKREIHHIRDRKSFEANEGHLCNCAENIQILPKSIHEMVTRYGKKKKIEEFEYPECQQQLMEKFLKWTLESSIAAGEEPFAIFKTSEDNPEKRKVSAHLIKSCSFDDKQDEVVVNM